MKVEHPLYNNLSSAREKHKVMEEWEAQRDSLCGFDEAGRGPLAGPVVAGAVILGENFPLGLLGDSKKLTEKAREKAYEVIISQAQAWGIGWVWPEEIDRINILQASLVAMKRAWENIIHPKTDKSDLCNLGVADGLYIPNVDFRVIPLVKADDLVPAVSAASILAKVTRDRWMVEYSKKDGRYGFEVHKGYPTKAHREALMVHGLSEIHRISFKWKSP